MKQDHSWHMGDLPIANMDHKQATLTRDMRAIIVCNM